MGATEVVGAGRQQQRRQQTRAEIVAAAWAQARERGLAGISLRDLASEVGMRAPSLYSYFPSKDAIYDAMFADGNRAFLVAIGAWERELAGVTPGDRRRLLAIAATRFLEFICADPVRAQLLFQRPVPAFEPSAESYALAVEALEHTRQFLLRLGADRDLDLDLWRVLTTGLLEQHLSNDPGGDAWRALVEPVVEMFCCYLERRLS